ncbi:Hypothetical predicted protein, partial [Paramuricea clavata]
TRADSCSKATAASLISMIRSLSKESNDAYFRWLSSSPDSEELFRISTKKNINAALAACDMVIVSLNSIAGISDCPESPKNEKKRLPKIEMRPFCRKNPKLWFDHLEIIFASSDVLLENHRFAALLKLLDETASSLLSELTRSQRPELYSEAKDLLIKEFSLSKFDRVKEYIFNSSPGPDERLTHFASRVEVLMEDISIDDVKKFCLLRHSPPAVRLQLAGRQFEKVSLGDLLKEADTLTQRATQDSMTVGHIQGGNRKNQARTAWKESKVCHFHKKFGNDAYQCTGGDKCHMWNEKLKLVQARSKTSDTGSWKEKGNDSGNPSRG